MIVIWLLDMKQISEDLPNKLDKHVSRTHTRTNRLWCNICVELTFRFDKILGLLLINKCTVGSLTCNCSFCCFCFAILVGNIIVVMLGQRIIYILTTKTLKFLHKMNAWVLVRKLRIKSNSEWEREWERWRMVKNHSHSVSFVVLSVAPNYK